MNSTVSILDIVEDTTVDGPGFRTTIYAAGCPRRCPGCHNPQSWEIANGKPRSIDAIMDRIKQAEFSNVTFSGGDPLLQVEAFTELARRIRQETGKTIWCYTGYLHEEIAATPKLAQILPFVDVLVDGPYMENLRDESLRFRGSSNQRIIDLNSKKNTTFAVQKHTTEYDKYADNNRFQVSGTDQCLSRQGA
ncbi:anaerobic ribonucleoside-triphosphate reductase-activating protein [Bacteroidia bacterium]|nr:anaerobic ribonucleoside-triphosphate reductase-activating protein [Bacteroidia bacterium]